MTDDEASGSQYERYLARQRAGETKKRRTREKLIHACDYVLHEKGMNATVEAIAEDAGVSTATFYTFYHSRNELCLDAFTELVLVPLESLDASDRPYQESADALLKRCEGRSSLIRAALIGRLERTDEDELIEVLAALLQPHPAAHMAALWLLDAVAMNRPFNF